MCRRCGQIGKMQTTVTVRLRTLECPGPLPSKAAAERAHLRGQSGSLHMYATPTVVSLAFRRQRLDACAPLRKISTPGPVRLAEERRRTENPLCSSASQGPHSTPPRPKWRTCLSSKLCKMQTPSFPQCSNLLFALCTALRMVCHFHRQLPSAPRRVEGYFYIARTLVVRCLSTCAQSAQTKREKERSNNGVSSS